MKIIRVKDYDEMSEKAAAIISSQICAKPDSMLGLATGSSVQGIYKKLIESYIAGELDFSQINTVNLDEYVGLSSDDEHSYYYYMNKNLFNHVNIKKENVHLPDGLAEDVENECMRYNAIIGNSGGIDIQLLGLGANGHIGFNEPCNYFAKDTHVIELDEVTIRANARFFNDESQVPRRAITMGIGNIMSAKKIVLCVSGAHKAGILNQVLTGPVMPEIPGSILQFHPDCTVVADTAALGQIRKELF